MTELSNKDVRYIADKRYWILDVDGCLYPRDPKECGYYQDLTVSIQQAFNTIVNKDRKGSDILEQTRKAMVDNGFKGDLSKVDGTYDGFVPFIKAIKNNYPEDFYQYMNVVYGSSYSMIKGDSQIAGAFKMAERKGVDISFYTNGPSSKKEGEFAHAQKILITHLVDISSINRYRSKTYDLLDSIEAGDGKPTASSMVKFLDFAKIDNTDNTVMFDDSIANLKTAAEFGILPVWTWTTDEEPSKKDLAIAEEIGAIRVRNTGDMLLRVAKTI